ncbi:hypothetical protein E5C33_20060 [Stenotrophomonas maltophilia]|uniref:hypothetical protein n=1 Tax=Stenotrophomonas maltophilia TaxID=40324 RepID=UPI00107621DC|nr:hypothetical protein [Stenotrophomonas maltophilia]TFZ42360.1 hypothetical protein E5C33_20060 [Stenotrophomonas maltophilia]
MRKSFLLWAFPLFLIGCSSPPGLRVSVSNESSEAIYQVRLRAGGNAFGTKQLSAGDRVSGQLNVVSDSAAELVYGRSPDSAESHCQGDVYVAVGARQALNVAVGRDGCTFSIE